MEDQVVRFMCGTEDSQLVQHVSRMSVQGHQRVSSHCGWHMSAEEDLIEPSLSTLVISVRDLQPDQLPDLLLVQHDQQLEEQLDEQQQWWCADQWDDASCSFVGILDAMEEISFNLSSFWHWFWDWISFYMENQNKVFLVFPKCYNIFISLSVFSYFISQNTRNILHNWEMILTLPHTRLVKIIIMEEEMEAKIIQMNQGKIIWRQLQQVATKWCISLQRPANAIRIHIFLFSFYSLFSSIEAGTDAKIKLRCEGGSLMWDFNKLQS